MSDLFSLSHNLELRDPAGHTVGIVLPAKAAQELTGERDELRAEVDRLHAELTELQRALDQARQEASDKAAVVAERDRCLEHLEMFWAEKIAGMDENAVDFGEFIAELERDLGARGLLDAK
jgi:predicted  nucleic acid-binding Zn-ribbon protein